MNTTFNSTALFCLLDKVNVGLVVFKKNTLGWQEWNCEFANDFTKNVTATDQLSNIKITDLINESIFDFDFINNPSIVIYSSRLDKNIELLKPTETEEYLLLTLQNCVEPNCLIQKYQGILLQEAEQNMLFGSWVWDLNTNLMEWSTGLYNLLGLPASDETIQASSFQFLESVDPRDREMIRSQFVSIPSFDSIYILEFRIVDKLGTIKSLYFRGENVIDRDTGSKVSIATILDISTLKEMRSELERKVADLNHSNADLEQFAYVASHDLQEPLRKIVSFGERLQIKAQTVIDKEQQFYLDRILGSTRRMQEMINNLLEFSRISSTDGDFKVTDLNGILKGTLSDLEIAINEKNAKIEVDHFPKIEAVASQISQLFINLIGNALKFSRSDRPVEIKIKCTDVTLDEIQSLKLPLDKEYIRLTFEDNGIGFDKANAEKIFTIFKRLRGRSEFEGSGIGLSVCKKVVEVHNGIIVANGVPDEGAKFEVVLPKVHG